MSDPLAALRARIDDADLRVLEAVNQRVAAVRELWRLKAELGVDRIDPEREQLLRAALARANAGPLSPEGLDELVTELLALTKRELQRPGRDDA
ncbi:MAG TPA: chorismate mutase [Gaiella sp.]|jgi:3-deoxy-7-phosphoheptulonate synthase/chorismate mutase